MCAINYNSALLITHSRAKCFTLWKRPESFLPSPTTLRGLPRGHFLSCPCSPGPSLALTQASSHICTFRTGPTALKSLSLVWISDVNSGLRLEKALFVYICTQDLYLTLSANGPQSCMESEILGISIDQCCLLPPCPSTEQQGLPSPSEAAPLLWDRDNRLQALLQPPMFPHSFSPPCSNSFSGCPEKDAHAQRLGSGAGSSSREGSCIYNHLPSRLHHSLWQTRIMPTCLPFL